MSRRYALYFQGRDAAGYYRHRLDTFESFEEAREYAAATRLKRGQRLLLVSVPDAQAVGIERAVIEAFDAPLGCSEKGG